MSNRQPHDESAFDETLALRLGRLISDSKHGRANNGIKSTSTLQVKQGDIPNVEGGGSKLEKKQPPRPASASTSLRLSRPSLFAAAARVIEGGGGFERCFRWKNNG